MITAIGHRARSRDLFIAVMMFLSSVCVQAQSIEAITYNIRYDNAEDGDNAWDKRKAGLVNQLKFYEPDVFGIQEGEHHQVEYINAALPDHAYVGVGREDGESGGEFSAVFYDTRRLKVLEDHTFWLSATPAEPSLGWDAAIKRVCTYARFEDLVSAQTFWVFNTHFDHIGVVAREQSAILIRDQIGRINVQRDPVLLMGDFNAEPGSAPITVLASKFSDTREEASFVVFGPDGTRSGFSADQPVTRRIDYIFTSPGDWDVSKYAVLSDSKDVKFYSDHLPVYVQLTPRSD